MDTKNFIQLNDLSIQNLGQHYLGYYIKVTLNDGDIRNGYLYTLDPTLGNLILINDEKNGAIAIMHHAMDMIADLKMTIKDMDELFNYNQDEYNSNASWILERREAFVAYLEKSRIPFRYDLNDPVIHVLGRARVHPPYVTTSVLCDNNIIRDRVREMIMNLF
ncbi:hypothetical protein INT45_006361 [Circinella minor]|uniref:AD domain-containing protein n=1 Tax=Circinella minor TaxID=1195481 RepID=A0A8H7SCP1_9FUNG|nr:hypothetical protein INT45_006361 [Circinella minor]